MSKKWKNNEEWLVDGQNLIHHATLSRPQLFSLLADFASSSSCRVRVILDGEGRDEELQPHQTPLLAISYSHGYTADTVIEKCLCREIDPAVERAKRIVVTGDRALSDMARGAGARVMSPRDFMALLKDEKKASDRELGERRADALRFNRPFEGKL